MDAYYCGIMYIIYAILYGAGRVIRGYAYRNAVLYGVVKVCSEDYCNTQPTPTHTVHFCTLITLHLHIFTLFVTGIIVVLLFFTVHPHPFPTVPTHIHTRLGAGPRIYTLFCIVFM